MNNPSLIMIIVSGALINNVVLNQFLGICSFLGVSKQMKASISLGGAVIFVITIASAVASLLYDYVLQPLGMDFMKTIIFILVIALFIAIMNAIGIKTRQRQLVENDGCSGNCAACAMQCDERKEEAK